MKLARIRAGDVVLVDDGHPFVALVTGREPRRLLVAPIGSHHNPRPVRASEVAAHWRLAQGEVGGLLVGAREHRRVVAALYPTRGRGVEVVAR